MKLGILGGTFDPVHEGHLALARAAREQLDLDKVIFIPSLTPPHKTSRRDLAPAQHRFHMVELAVKNCQGFEVSDIEFKHPESPYTVDTLRALKKQYPKDRLYLIMGGDSAAEFSTWREPEAIEALATLAAAPREGNLKTSERPGMLKIRMSPCLISASEIRRRIGRGEKNPAGMLPREIESYIEKMNLYRKLNRDAAS